MYHLEFTLAVARCCREKTFLVRLRVAAVWENHNKLSTSMVVAFQDLITFFN